MAHDFEPMIADLLADGLYGETLTYTAPDDTPTTHLGAWEYLPPQESEGQDGSRELERARVGVLRINLPSPQRGGTYEYDGKTWSVLRVDPIGTVGWSLELARTEYRKKGHLRSR